ncbi:MAG TPA: hypothetical protein VFN35_13505, partial [Ktedonobacteraceae bacterium]|nr:hypothetical protein [Ktedonobacteraceae bacterium]
MKSNYQSRYADLLTESADEALNKLIRDLDGAYTAPVRPADLSWEAAQRRLTLVKKTGSALPSEQPLQVHTTHRRKGPFFLAAAIVALAILSTTVLGAIGIIRFPPGQST